MDDSAASFGSSSGWQGQSIGCTVADRIIDEKTEVLRYDRGIGNAGWLPWIQVMRDAPPLAYPRQGASRITVCGAWISWGGQFQVLFQSSEHHPPVLFGMGALLLVGITVLG